MKLCMALAGLVCLAATGCAGLGNKDCGDGCSNGGNRWRNAPRPLITRDGSRPNCNLIGEDCRDACNGYCPCGPCG